MAKKQGGSSQSRQSAVPPGTRRRDGPSPTNSAATASTVSTKNSSSSSRSNGSRTAATRKSAGKGGSAGRANGGKRGGAAASTKGKGKGGNNKGNKGRRQATPLTPQEERAAKRNKIISRIITLLVVLGCLFCAWKFALNSPITPEQWKEGFGQAQENAKTNIGAIGDKINDVLENLDGFEWGNFFKDDPWQGETDVTLWKEKYIERNGGGLTLTIVNNLDDKWQEEFEVAVADWKRSDALTLTIVKGSADKGCTREQGVMVVCNDNFGETGWVGINENEVETGSNRIISSLAKMNEYYLRNANFYHRRFTMCHEIGHGFGLPHTDENPKNKNLGDCMDYTDDPEENLDPGQVNFDKLSAVYLAQPEAAEEEPVRRRLLRRVEKDDGNVIETIALVVNEDKAETWGL